MEFNHDNILKQYLGEVNYKVRSGKGGMNNTTLFVETTTGKFVLRIYRTHKDIDKVTYEHHILCRLGTMGLPFGTPVPVHSSDGETVKFTEDGKPAALFQFMEGDTPDFSKPEHLESFGVTAGRLSEALRAVKSELQPVYRPYYDLENAHPRCPISEVISFCKQPRPEFEGHSAELLIAAAELEKFKKIRAGFDQLPHQLVHGDLNASNVLADKEGNISAVLDFEFVTEDLRVMELCVCLSEIINIKDTEEMLWKRLRAFIKGFAASGLITKQETEVIPALIMLRRLDVFIHFLGRYWDGVDKSEVVVDQLHNLCEQAKWLAYNSGKLMTLII